MTHHLHQVKKRRTVMMMKEQNGSQRTERLESGKDEPTLAATKESDDYHYKRKYHHYHHHHQHQHHHHQHQQQQRIRWQRRRNLVSHAMKHQIRTLTWLVRNWLHPNGPIKVKISSSSQVPCSKYLYLALCQKYISNYRCTLVQKEMSHSQSLFQFTN